MYADPQRHVFSALSTQPWRTHQSIRPWVGRWRGIHESTRLLPGVCWSIQQLLCKPSLAGTYSRKLGGVFVVDGRPSADDGAAAPTVVYSPPVIPRPTVVYSHIERSGFDTTPLFCVLRVLAEAQRKRC
jgi:hypothetical protein